MATRRTTEAQPATMLPTEFQAAKDRVNGATIDPDGTPVQRKAVFEYEGVSYAIEDADEWSAEVMELLESGAAFSALALILGEEQYAKWKVGKKRKDIEKVYQAMAKVTGGNS